MPIARASKRIMKQVGLAIQDWDMIQNGDRLLLGLSGGKDSMALLHVLLQKQRTAPVNFEIACATIDPQTDSFDPSPLIGYCEAMGVTYHYLSEPIVELAKTKMQGDSLCAFCSRFKRGLLYNCCRDFNYNKLVLAQHLDDLAESFIMSAFHGGQVRTMKAHYKIEAGDVHVIRPLVYVRETDTRDFASDARLPIINENCPACFEEPKERHRVKKLLQQEEASVPGLFGKLKHALIPLMDDDLYVATKAVMGRIADNNSSNRRIKRKATPGAPPPAKKAAAEGNNTVASLPTSSMDIDMSKKYSCNDGLCFEIA
jgi:tRNA 2-thiocytidine biosynthesis protein TtcA